MADVSLGQKHILVVQRRITEIVTKAVYRNSKGHFIKTHRGRLFLMPVEPRTVNTYQIEYELNLTD